MSEAQHGKCTKVVEAVEEFLRMHFGNAARQRLKRQREDLEPAAVRRDVQREPSGIERRGAA